MKVPFITSIVKNVNKTNKTLKYTYRYIFTPSFRHMRSRAIKVLICGYYTMQNGNYRNLRLNLFLNLVVKD